MVSVRSLCVRSQQKTVATRSKVSWGGVVGPSEAIVNVLAGKEGPGRGSIWCWPGWEVCDGRELGAEV